MLRIVAFYVSLKCEGLCIQGLQLPVIDTVGAAVVGGQGDVTLFFVGLKRRHVPRVQSLQCAIIEPVVAYLVQELDKIGIGLAVDMPQFDADHACLLQGVAAEEVTGVVIGFEQAPFIIPDHGRELMQVADHEQLHATKRQVTVFVTA